MKSRIKIQIVPTRLGCWSVWVNGMRIIKSTREPLVDIAARMLAAGHKRDATLVMTRTPDGPCRVASTIGNAAVACAQRHPFRAPDWKPFNLNNNGVH